MFLSLCLVFETVMLCNECMFAVFCASTDVREHKSESFSSRRDQQTRGEGKQHIRSLQSLVVKAPLSNSNPRRGLSHQKDEANFSPSSGRHTLFCDKRESRASSGNDNGSHVEISRHQRGSSVSKPKHHSSAHAVDGQLRQSIYDKQPTSHEQKVSHRRSHSADLKSKPFGTEGINSPVFRDNLSNSALKQRMANKLRWISSLPQDAHKQHAVEDTRRFEKSPVCTKSRAKHKKEIPSAVNRDGTLAQC